MFRQNLCVEWALREGFTLEACNFAMIVMTRANSKPPQSTHRSGEIVVCFCHREIPRNAHDQVIGTDEDLSGLRHALSGSGCHLPH